MDYRCRAPGAPHSEPWKPELRSAYRLLIGLMDDSSKWQYFCEQRCTTTALSTWGMSTYPLPVKLSRVVRREALKHVGYTFHPKQDPVISVTVIDSPCTCSLLVRDTWNAAHHNLFW